MASITHLAAGTLCGAIYSRKTDAEPISSMAVFAALALSPDLDFLAARFGSDGTPLEHRVMTHALPFALVIGAAIGWGGRRRRVAGVLGALALASHGLLDAMTNNAPAPQLLWPFLRVPIQLPWHPIPGTQSYQEYFTLAGVHVVLSEALVCLPFVLAIVWVFLRKSRRMAWGAGRQRVISESWNLRRLLDYL